MRRPTISKLRRFFADEKGATSIEYAIIAAGVAGAIIVIVTTTGDTVKAMYQSVSTNFR